MKIKKIIAVLLIIFAISSLSLAGYLIYKSISKEESKELKELDNIEKYGYTLYDSKSELYKQEFKNLKTILNSEQINEEEYAKSIAKLFAIDFYSLSDKKTNTDIGGTEFMYPSIKENFILKATDTLYKYVESNVYGERTQKLPKVMKVEVESCTETIYKNDDFSDEKSYEVTLNVTYNQELGYPSKVVMTMSHSDNKLYIVEIK